MAYIDGYVLAVPKANKQAYIEMTQRFDPIFLQHGALKVVEAWGDDVPDGKVTSFPIAVKLEADEVVVFSYVYWPDKATRDAGQAAFMADPRVASFDTATNPFDSKRMIFGGFEVFTEF
jgi:uncharacterized protein YbaA (DUF1428 family)